MRPPVCCCLLLLVVAVARGQGFDDFDLSEALPAADSKPTAKPPAGDSVTEGAVDLPRKPTTKPQPGDVPQKPTTKPQPGGDDIFDLSDALHPNDPYEKPTNKPQPGHGGGGGGGVFGDGDLGEVDPNHPSGHDDKPSGRALQPSAGGEDHGQGGGGDNQNIVAGVIGAVAAAAVGAVSSFIAYQKKKLCFKETTDDPEAVNMDSHKGDQSEPQVQSTLLEK